jgi:hypothetical protein
MNQVTCGACGKDVVPRPPVRALWAMIASFWVLSLLFGIGAAITAGLSFVLLLAWLIFASLVGVVSQRATSHTCPSCGEAVAGSPPSGRPREA